MLASMAQPHKGDRHQILAPVAQVVAARLRCIRLEHCISSVSQLSADLLAIAVGQPELARELHQQVLPVLAAAEASVGKAKACSASREHIKVRAVDVVARRLRNMAIDHDTNLSQVTADLLAIAVGCPELVHDLHREVMPLAM
jgi:hypothetical protein